jgi:(E)-4-hydroxy-3-methylbut-2-enyl-diphosphate synthase
MRIGVNHGSLSARTLSRFGDTPAGMVESAFEFARICRKHDYHNFVFSMKASNPLVMVQAYRLLAHEMYKIDWDYPLHLGVTEAGEGEDGRMKSAIGIGALLLDGLGDTIRVSLTEASHLEMEPCTRLRDLGMKACAENVGVEAFEEQGRDFKSFERRPCDLPSQKADDPIDMRNILHRDGSVLSAVTPAALATEDPFYRELGTKLAVGMPLRDIATSDSIFLREIPGNFLVSSFPNPGTHCFAGCPEYTVCPYIAQYTTDLTLSFPGISPNRRKGEPEPSPFTGDRVRRGGANRGARRDARSERGGAC